MRFAFLVMGEFQWKKDRAGFCEKDVQMIGVGDIEQACMAARALQEQGVECIELCGAFGEAGARQVIAATQNALPVGYVVHFPEQDHLFRQVFGDKA